MPLVTVKLVKGVFTTAEKHAMAAKLTDVMVEFEGSEAFREVVWVMIEELNEDGWHMGGKPFEGPKTLMDHLGRAKATFEATGGLVEPVPKTRPALAERAPVVKR
jgi:4-oxalocrotonate tautomerase